VGGAASACCKGLLNRSNRDIPWQNLIGRRANAGISTALCHRLEVLTLSLLAALRPEASQTPASGIVEVSTYGRAREGVIPMWVGEGDTPTPSFISDAATRSLAAGETFYTWQRGIPDLRDAIARYMTRTYSRPFDREQFYVTGGGMQAVQIAIRMVAGVGDEVIIPTPAWPNFAAAVGISGAKTVTVQQTFGNQGWTLDMELMAKAITPQTKAIVINSPSNPTGWTATHEELQAVLTLARQHGLWIIADEIYGRFVYESERAPSFHDVMDADDRILFVQTMSKNWAMTGWRLGWIECAPALGPIVENLIQYSTSGSPVFVQRAAIAALDNGDGFIAHQIARARLSRDVLCDALSSTGKARFLKPAGAFYLFFSVDGITDTRNAVLRMIDDVGVGVAPGTAFGPGSEAFFRLCFARSPEQAAQAADRIRRWITT
jgi:aspartate/methionine/tyrosine aminotransferase